MRSSQLLRLSPIEWGQSPISKANPPFLRLKENLSTSKSAWHSSIASWFNQLIIIHSLWIWCVPYFSLQIGEKIRKICRCTWARRGRSGPRRIIWIRGIDRVEPSHRLGPLVTWNRGKSFHCVLYKRARNDFVRHTQCRHFSGLFVLKFLQSYDAWCLDIKLWFEWSSSTSLY